MKTLFDRELTLEEAEALIKNGEDVNQRNHIGRTPLFYVQNVEVAKLFIKLGANVNEKDRNGCSPLFYITDVNIVQLLINNKADVNHRNNHNATPIFNYKDSNIFLLLINSGADLNARSSIDGGITLIDSVVSAYREYHLDHVKLLILRGAIFGKIDKYQAFSDLFTKEQQNAFDAFMSITNNDNDFYQMCLAYQNDIKIDIKEMDIL